MRWPFRRNADSVLALLSPAERIDTPERARALGLTADARRMEVQAMIDAAKESGTHYLIARWQGGTTWVVRCRWCGCYGSDLPSPESALRHWYESNWHQPDDSPPCEQPNPWHPDPEKVTRGH